MHVFRLLSNVKLITTLFAIWTPAHVIGDPTHTPLSLGSYDYGFNVNQLVKRQSLPPVAVTGAGLSPNSSGPVPLRLEIRELQRDDAAWNLYILGLDMMQGMDQNDPLSWYSVMGIHGRPFKPYDNVQPSPGNEGNGFCAHVSVLFPTWHRPYLALFEQIMYNLIQTIANFWPEGPERDRHVAAAASFRIPYWDWARSNQVGGSVLPASVGGSPAIDVLGPFGSQTIRNPLYSYAFDPLNTNDLLDWPFNQYTETQRFPTTQDGTSRSQNDLVEASLQANAVSFRGRLFNLFTNYPNYTVWSNEAYTPSQADSIESLHDQIHGLVGSGGHMTYIEYSAFDPTFMLHHAMIDRCFAMWQVLNPTSYVEPEAAVMATFTDSAGQIQDVNSALTPFYRPDGQFWTSSSVASTQNFNYAYAETQGSDAREKVITAINTLYGSSTTTPTRFGTSRPASSNRTTRRHVHLKPRDALAVGQVQEWIANIVVSKQALPQTFFIHILLGPFDRAHPETWSRSAALVGTHVVFGRAGSSSRSPPINVDNPDLLVSAAIPLTEKLAQHIQQGRLNSLDPVDVEPYLRQNLRYRITLANGVRVARRRLPSLNVSVVSSILDREGPASDGRSGARKGTDAVDLAAALPTWGPFRAHGDVEDEPASE